MKIPAESYLNTRYTLFHEPKKAREDFFEFGRSRIRYVSPEEFNAIFYSIWDESMTANYGFVICDYTDSVWFTREERGKDRHVNALSIYIAPDHFKPPFTIEDYSDLIPITIEHELWEIWLVLRHGSWISNADSRHLFARSKEYQYALKIGKSERLLALMLKSDRPELEEQYKYARNKIERRPAFRSR